MVRAAISIMVIGECSDSGANGGDLRVRTKSEVWARIAPDRANHSCSGSDARSRDTAKSHPTGYKSREIGCTYLRIDARSNANERVRHRAGANHYLAPRTRTQSSMCRQ